MLKPTPVPQRLICSVCGLDWERHGKTPKPEKCIELLKADLAKRPAYVFGQGGVSNATPTWRFDTTGGSTL